MAAVKTFGERIADTLVEDGLLQAKQKMTEPEAFRSVSRMKSISGVSLSRAESALQRSGVVPIGVVT